MLWVCRACSETKYNNDCNLWKTYQHYCSLCQAGFAMGYHQNDISDICKYFLHRCSVHDINYSLVLFCPTLLCSGVYGLPNSKCVYKATETQQYQNLSVICPSFQLLLNTFIIIMTYFFLFLSVVCSLSYVVVLLSFVKTVFIIEFKGDDNLSTSHVVLLLIASSLTVNSW